MKNLKRIHGVLLPALVLAALFTVNISRAQNSYAVVERGLDYAVHERTAVEDGTNRVDRYIELATGLNYTNASGQLVPAKEEIDVLPQGGASATQGRHQAYFPGDIYQGQIEVVTPDGLHLKSRPLGIFYDDGSNTVMIAVLTNSVGVLVASNQVIYPNAFTGIKADLRYTYRKGGFEQDIVLQEQPPTPESFGMSSKSTRLQALTEFFNAPAPKQATVKIQSKSNAGLSDTTLTFGKMKMMQGKAFAIGNTISPAARSRRIPVYKSWVQLQGRTFLIEELPVQTIATQLQQLPASASATVSLANPVLRRISATRLLPPVKAVKTDSPAVRLAKADLNYKSGVVLDYVEVSTDQTDFTFESNTTYLVDGAFYLGGTTTFEGGAVIKGDYDGELYIDDGSTINCQTSSYHPAIFTSVNDDSVGESMSGSGDPYYTGSPAIGDTDFFYDGSSGGHQFHDMRFSYAYAAISLVSCTASLTNAQFIDCNECVFGSVSSTSVSLDNSLVSHCGYVGDIANVVGNNTTFDQLEWGIIYGGNAYLTNCVLANVPYAIFDWVGGGYEYGDSEDISAYFVLAADHNGFYDSQAFGTGQTTNTTNPFQTDGGGSCYLASGCSFHGAGTANVDPLVLADIQTKTTYAPFVDGGGGDIAADLTLYPCVLRDTASAPDLGYHYDPVDFRLDSLTVESGVTLTLTHGAVFCVPDGALAVDGTLNAGQTMTNCELREAQTAPSTILIGGNASDAYTDTDHDGLPDWFEVYWFGNLNQTASGLDTSGGTLLSDYQNGYEGDSSLDVIEFSIDSTNYYVSQRFAGVQLNVTAGAPSYYAVVLNNGTTTNWLAFTTTNLTVDFGLLDGVYDVHVGLRGSMSNSSQAWEDATLTVDRVAPVIVITNPVVSGGSATVIEPFVQLQGFASEPLSSLSYDISNATGVVSNQPCYVTDQAWDTNKFDYTTNWFQAYDVPLTTNGVNSITLHVSDRAGNLTTTNFNVTLDYSGATNPVVSLTWPTNGMDICGSSFTLRGTVDDPCASVSATITDTNGDVTTIGGEVERSGVLWVENLPLAEGTNWITLDVTNAAGLSSATNIAVVKSDMTLNLTSITGDLWNPTVNVSGTISPYAGYTVTVNGVQATNDDGSWSAVNVPISSSGVASFDMSASSGGGDPYESTNVIKDAEVRYVSYHDSKSSSYTDASGNTTTSTREKDYNPVYAPNGDGQWFLQSYQGSAVDHTANPDGSWQNDSYEWSNTNQDVYYTHYTDNLGADDHYTNIIGGAWDDDGDDWYQVTGLPDEDLSVDGWGGEYGIGDGYPPTFVYHYFADNVHWHLAYYDGSYSDVSVNAQTTQLRLFTGGKAGINHRNLIQLQCWGEQYGKPDSGPWMDTPVTTIDPSTMKVLGQSPGSDGNLWVAEPDNAELELNLTAPGVQHYGAWATPTKYELRICHGSRDITDSNFTVIVGQQINLTCQIRDDTDDTVTTSGMTNFQWTVPGYAISNFVADGSIGIVYSNFPVTGSNVVFYWVDGGSDRVVQCSATVNGVKLTGKTTFDVIRPVATVISRTGTIAVDTNYTVLNLDGTTNLNNVFALHYGNPVGTPGIAFTNSTLAFSYFTNSGYFLEWVQIVNYATNQVQTTDGTWHFRVLVTNAMLDTIYPYILNVTNTSDSPATLMNPPSNFQAASAYQNFSMWLMFKPIVFNGISIPNACYVPLSVVNWSWNATANAYATNGPLTSSNNVVNPAGIDSTIYPQWTDNATNHEYSTP